VRWLWGGRCTRRVFFCLPSAVAAVDRLRRPPPHSLFHSQQHDNPQSKKHIKRTEDNPGGVITVETPIHYSNVRLVDPVTKAPVRVGWRYLEDGSKVRVTKGSRASGSVVPRPALLAQRRAPRPLPGPADTPVSVAARVTRGEADLPSALAELAVGGKGRSGGGVAHQQRRTFSSGSGGGGQAWPPRAWVGFAAGGVRGRW
jgi:hypothetical protein